MRLLKTESASIARLMQATNFHDQYLLVKKRGWVYVKIKGNTFAFHRKEFAELINGSLREGSQYYVKRDGISMQVSDFTDVLDMIEDWLASLDS